MLKHHSPAELNRIFSLMGIGGGLGFCLSLWLVHLDEHLNAIDHLSFVALGSGIVMIISSAVITWRKSA